MLLQIPQVLNKTELELLQAYLNTSAVWNDGKASAAGRAKNAKYNLQLSVATVEAKEWVGKVTKAIAANIILNAAARPEKLARLMINRYETGMSYGNHVDAAYIDNTRTDLSFTLFLNDPQSYEGGDLIVEETGHRNRFKLPAGDLILYSTRSVHRVAEVTSGVRNAAVGWIRSRIRSEEQRALLFDLEKTIWRLDDSALSADTLARLSNIRNNLLRMWGE